MHRSTKALLLNLTLAFRVAGCAALPTENWPDLREGFETRDDPRLLEDEAGREAAPAGAIDPLGEADMYALSEEFTRLSGRLSRQHQRFITVREALLAANDEDRERHWFSAQLELSRLHGFGDEIADLDKRIVTARAAGHTTIGASLFADMQDLKRRAQEFLAEERVIVETLTPEAFRPEDN